MKFDICQQLYHVENTGSDLIPKVFDIFYKNLNI